MHLKNFPKRLDSKTSCLRITVPENLDLALEGLIRKVLREQPKTDYIHSFAADYFETLLRIRDRAGAKYSSAQLCPFHNDEDAHEMIKLASTFSKPLKKNGKEPREIAESGKGTESGVRSRETGGPKGKVRKEGKQKGSIKQVTPDLIKKLVGEEAEENDEEESLTGDPIKELVEKELKMEAVARRNEGESKKTLRASSGEETRRAQPEEEASVVEGDEERGEIRDKSTEELVDGSNGRSEAREEASEETGGEGEKNKEGTDDVEETTDAKETRLVLGHETPVEICAAEKETDVRKDDGKPSADETDTKKMEGKTPAEAQTVEDELPTGEKDGVSKMADEISASDVLPDGADVETRGGESGREIAAKAAEGEENKSEKGEIMAGSDGTEPKADIQPLKDTTMEDSTAEVQEKSDAKTEIESAGGKDVKTEAETADTAVEETIRTTSPLLKNTDEQKINAESGDQQQKEHREPGMDSESERKKPEGEGKPPTEEEGGSEKIERDEPEKTEKSKTEEEVEPDGEITIKENVLVASFEEEDMAPAGEEVPSEQKKPGPITREAESKANTLDQPKGHETDEGSKEDAAAKEKPSEEQKDETAVEEETGNARKPGSKSQPLSQGGDDLERAEGDGAPPSVNGAAEPEKTEETVDVKDAEPEPNVKESESEAREDELRTVADTRQVPPEGQEKEDAKEPEEELCTVVDSQHIIRIEEPEEAKHDTGVPPPSEEVQIKTIQTHYYDALQVPETVTKELRVHNVSDALSVAPHLADLVGAERNGHVDVEDLNAVQQARLTESAPVESSSSGEISAETAPQQREDGAAERQPSERPSDVPPLVEAPSQHELGPDTRRSETDDLLDLMTPTSGYSVSVSELSWQTVSGMFLDSERRHSSRLSEELRGVSSKSGENIDRAEEGPESAERRPEIEEVFHERVVPTLVGAVPIPPRDAEQIQEEENAGHLENAQEKEEKKKAEREPLGGSSPRRSFDSDTPFISVEVKTVIETQILDDEDDGEGRPGLELKVEAIVDVGDTEEETRKESESSPEGEEKEMSEGGQKGGEGGAKAAERSESGERTAAREGSSGESTSTISSAATEIKRSDPGRRAVGREGSLLQSQSLDLGGRNPLLRTRSLSTFRHGVTDFEVWSAIEKELEEAATKIQARFRSYKARKKLQRGNAVQVTTEESSVSTTSAEAEERQQSTGEFHDSIVLSDHPR